MLAAAEAEVEGLVKVREERGVRVRDFSGNRFRGLVHW